MTGTLRYCLVLLALCAAGASHAKGSAEAGATKAAVCMACHTANGTVLSAEWPVLAGQSAVYIYKQVKLYHGGKRRDATASMPAIIAPLTDQDMEDIAAYYATLTPAGLEAEKGSFESGRRLWLAGDRARAIPACAACHGPEGAGQPASGYPALRAQPSVYTTKQLTAYMNQTRYTVNAKGDSEGGDYALIMQTIAKRLTADDIKSLSAYMQGLR